MRWSDADRRCSPGECCWRRLHADVSQGKGTKPQGRPRIGALLVRAARRMVKIAVAASGLFNSLIVDADAADVFTLKCDYTIIVNELMRSRVGLKLSKTYTVDTKNKIIAVFDDEAGTHYLDSLGKVSSDQIVRKWEQGCLSETTTIDRNSGSYSVIGVNTCTNDPDHYSVGQCILTDLRPIPAKKF